MPSRIGDEPLMGITYQCSMSSIEHSSRPETQWVWWFNSSMSPPIVCRYPMSIFAGTRLIRCDSDLNLLANEGKWVQTSTVHRWVLIRTPFSPGRPYRNDIMCHIVPWIDWYGGYTELNWTLPFAKIISDFLYVVDRNHIPFCCCWLMLVPN